MGVRSGWLLPFLLLSVTLVGCSGRLSKFDPGVAGDGELEGTLERLRVEHGLPALAGVLVRHGELVEIGAVGVRAAGLAEPVTTGDRWHLGSIGKSMTATVAAVLVEDGVIEWTTTVGDVFPDFSESTRPEYSNVRREELLSQTAGLARDERQTASFERLVTSGKPLPEQRREWAAEILALAPATSRGTHLYGNTNYVVAGAMLEAVTGKSWEDLLQRTVLSPLKMSSTGYGAPGTVGAVADEPRGHLLREDGWASLQPDSGADNPPAVGPAGTIHATLADFARYLAVHLAGARGEGGLVSAETFGKLHDAVPGTGYALGWSVGEHSRAGGRVLRHTGSNGAWAATTWIAPERDFAILTVTNAGGAAAIDDALRALIDRCNAAPE